MDLKNKLRVALGLEPTEQENTNLAFQETLTDGTVITSDADSLAAGVSVSVLTEEGETMPLAPGKYETESGIGFSVEEEGIVAEIYDEELQDEEEEEEEAEEVEAKIVEEKTTEEKKYSWGEKLKEELDAQHKSNKEEILSAVGEMLTVYKEEVLTKIAELSGNTETLNTEIETKDKEIAELKKQPAVENLNTNKFNSNKVEFKEVSRREYSVMSAKDRFMYNLSKTKVSN